MSSLASVPKATRPPLSTRAWISMNPTCKCWGRLLHRKKWRPVMAVLILRWSRQSDLPSNPTPNHFGESELRDQGRWLYWRRRWPLEASLLLRWPLRRDWLVAPALSPKLEERWWGRQINPHATLWLMANVLPHRPHSRLARDFLRLHCPQRFCRCERRVLTCCLSFRCHLHRWYQAR